jgi:hypothetical protein
MYVCVFSFFVRFSRVGRGLWPWDDLLSKNSYQMSITEILKAEALNHIGLYPCIPLKRDQIWIIYICVCVCVCVRACVCARARVCVCVKCVLCYGTYINSHYVHLYTYRYNDTTDIQKVFSIYFFTCSLH